jgi:cbb3-type cytochrome oxidase cytochrome c subunit
MTPFRKFVLILVACFGVPWFVMVVQVLRAEHLTPENYDKDRDGMSGVFPGSTAYLQGELVYQREGCVQCHTQMIRPSFDGIGDGWKKGWGSDQSAIPHDAVRPNVLLDYMNEPVAPLGIMRMGPDLANVGYRGLDRNTLHVELYSPRAVNAWSVMPGYRYLYEVRPIEGAGSSNALKFPPGEGPGPDLEVVPTMEADQLVTYLLSLRKDEPIPGHVPESAKK